MSASEPRAIACARAREARSLISAEEDAAITAAAERDPENPPLTEADMAAFRASLGDNTDVPPEDDR